MARGLWVSPSEFVKFAEPNKTLTEQIASRSRSIDFFGLGKIGRASCRERV